MNGDLSATARAYSNIAFIKYWGNLDDALRLPANGSLSMNLLGLHTTTNVRWLASPGDDSLTINDEPAQPNALRRANTHLDVIRERLDITHRAEIRSTNNFPMGAGIASSASAFAALTLAAVEASRCHALPTRVERLGASRLGFGLALNPSRLRRMVRRENPRTFLRRIDRRARSLGSC